jgi:hypothetical protein
LSWNPRQTTLTLLLGSLALSAGAACAYVYWTDPKNNLSTDAASAPEFQTLVNVPGLKRPPAYPARDVSLRASTEVIGISLNGKHRAYALGAMIHPSQHLVNDLLGFSPVTVTYCNKTNCVKVFTGKRRGKTLPISLGGWEGGMTEGKMLLKVDKRLYAHDSGKSVGTDPGRPFPFPRLKFVRTTWKGWKKAHPDTDVCLGNIPPELVLRRPDGSKPPPLRLPTFRK